MKSNNIICLTCNSVYSMDSVAFDMLVLWCADPTYFLNYINKCCSKPNHQWSKLKGTYTDLSKKIKKELKIDGIRYVIEWADPQIKRVSKHCLPRVIRVPYEWLTDATDPIEWQDIDDVCGALYYKYGCEVKNLYVCELELNEHNCNRCKLRFECFTDAGF